jgi:beta-galactosidase GanA
MRLRSPLLALALLSASICSPSLAQTGGFASSLPRIVENDGRFALMVDGAPYLMLGAQVNNSSAWPAMLPEVWPAIDKLHANTVEMPIYWEQWEPTQGHFDPSVLHTLLAQAREQHVHLVLLWFGTWKNGSGHYTPPFVKLNEAQAPHVVGRDGRKLDSLSPYSEWTLNADKTAFAALMRELKLSDPQHTVLMVQVENEIGTYGTVRDFSPAAQKLFNEAVPAELLKALDKQPAAGSSTWPQVFGPDADEYFYAWSIARYVNQIAAAGKAEYPLPLYINVATRDPFHGTPGSYESGGAVDRVLPIWKAGAPAIDVIGPDLYNPDYAVYTKLLDIYHRSDNAMLIPENGNKPEYARYFYSALGHQAIGFAVFGMDQTGFSNAPLGAKKIDDEALAPFALDYETFGPMDREIAKLNFEGKLQAVAENPADHYQTLHFGDWDALVAFGLPEFGHQDDKGAMGNDPADGGAMVAQLGPNEFLVTGVHARVDFLTTLPGKQRQFVRVEEGKYKDGVWQFERIWNGDQTDYGLNFTSASQVLKVTVATY